MRRTPLARTGGPVRRAPLARVGKKGKAHRARMDDLRPVVLARAFWRCEAQIEGVCNGAAGQAHHILPTEAGGPDHLDNLMAVCAPSAFTGSAGCHRWIHNNPKAATELGFLRSRYGRRVA